MQFLSDVVITADHSFITFHGRNTKGHYWYNYLYSKQELQPWIEKVNLQFKEMTGISLTQLEMRALEHAEKYLSNEL